MTSKGIIRRMQALTHEWKDNRDNRWVFLNCYTLMTENMLLGIEEGVFHDKEWVHRLLHHFADYYFRSVKAFDRKDPTIPVVWEIAHRTSQQPRTHVIQHLLLGINAHINYDLVFTLVSLLQPEWATLSNQKKIQRYEDYRLVNEIIAGTIDIVQDNIVETQEPLMDIVDKIIGPVDEWVASRLIYAWREEVWETALRILETPDEQGREKIRQDIENRTLKISNRILLKV